jgi:copper chaperone
VKTIQLSIDGMHCGGCVNRATQGVKNAGGTPLEISVGHARISYDESHTSPNDFVSALNRMGFTAKLAENEDGKDSESNVGPGGEK